MIKVIFRHINKYKSILELNFEYKITAAYIILGFLWIFFSDNIVYYFIKDTHLLTEVQTYKGAFFVLLTALLLYSMLKNHFASIRLAEQKARENDMLKSAFLQNIGQTAYATKGERELALKAGFNEYISKPYKMEQIIKLIENLN